jgi:hypothetical protein
MKKFDNIKCEDDLNKLLGVVNQYKGFDIRKKSRKRYVVEGKRLYSRVGYELFINKASLADIGSMVNIDHATTLYHIRKFNDLSKFDKSLEQDLNIVKFMMHSLYKHRALLPKTQKTNYAKKQDRVTMELLIANCR